MTYEGVAAAFDDTTFLHPELEAFIRGYFKDVNDATLKLGQVIGILQKDLLLRNMIFLSICLDTQILGIELSHRVETGTRAIPPDIRQKCLHFPRHSRAIAKGIRAYERRSLPK